MLTENARRLLADLYTLRAASLGQLVRLHAASLSGGEKAVYRLLEGLAERGLARVRTVPWDRRQRYAVLTADGYAVAWEYAEHTTATDLGAYRTPKESEARRLLLAAEFYCRAVRGGVPREWLVHRRELLARLRLDPRDVPFLLWLVDAGGSTWAVHIPWKQRYRARLEREIVLLPWPKAQHHVIFYLSSATAARDRARYVGGAPASGLHVFTPELAERWGAWLAAGKDAEADLGPTLRAAYPGAEILPPPPASPGSCLLRSGGEVVLVVDLRFERVGAAAAAERAARSGLEKYRWGAEVLYVFAEPRQLRVWARRLRDGAWAVVESAPGMVYRVRGGKAAREPCLPALAARA